MKLFGKNDRDAAVVVVVIIAIAAILLPNINRILSPSDEPSDISVLLREKRKSAKKKQNDGSSQYYNVNGKQAELFPFDPNTADSTQLLRLGLQPWQVRNIYKYRAAGGRYRKPTDFARLYGLTARQYEQLEPYITIQKELMAADVYGTRTSSSGYSNSSSTDYSTYENATPADRVAAKVDTTVFPRKIKAGEVVNINTADTTQLKKIPGIGSYFAKRIVALRERLGGLYSLGQLMEIENFPEQSFGFMTLGAVSKSTNLPSGVKRLKINSLSARELSRHPYVHYAQAKQIEEYRKARGNITSAADLEAIPSFKQADIARLAPYLDFE